MGSNPTTVCALIKPFPLSDEEMRERKARTAAKMRRVRCAKIGFVGGADWSDADDKLIRRKWPASPRDVVERALPDRSWAAITKRASDLGVRRSRSADSKSKQNVDPFFSSLREIREARGMTREALAERAGFHRVMLTRWELGEARPGWLNLRTWLDVLQYEIYAAPKNATLTQRGKRPWLEDEESILTELLGQGSSVPEVSLVLQRPPHEVEKRARTLGLLESEKTRNVSGMMRQRLS